MVITRRGAQEGKTRTGLFGSAQASTGDRARRWREEARELAAEHAPLALLVAVYVASYVLLCPRLTPWVTWIDVLLSFGFAVPAFYVAVQIARSLLAHRPYAWIGALRRRATTETLGGAVLALCLAAVFGAAASGWRDQIGTQVGFSWDRRLAALGTLLHFGHTPWVALSPLLRIPWAVRSMDLFYGPIWHIVTLSFIAWAAWSETRELRMRVMVCFLLSWIFLGTVVAYLFPAAGPIYFDQVAGGPSVFTPARLLLGRYHNLVSVHVAGLLWHTQGRGVSSGITAMPSMHLAESTLLALTSRHFGRVAGAAGFAFLAATLLCSIALGWHYSVDGYVSILGVALLWWLSGRFVAWYRGRIQVG